MIFKPKRNLRKTANVTRRRSNGEIEAGAEKPKKHPKRRASAQKLVSEKAPENDIMQDTRGEALTYEAPSRRPSRRPKARDTTDSLRPRTKITAPTHKRRPLGPGGAQRPPDAPEASRGRSRGLRRAPEGLGASKG